ncbi:MAG: hypothetical protein AAGN35_09570 [Bacteroidota bacterium]
MKVYFLLAWLVIAPGAAVSLAGQNLFVLQKEVETDSTELLVTAALAGTGGTRAVPVSLDSVRREISGNRRIYREWLGTREQASFTAELDAAGRVEKYTAEAPGNGMHDWMQAYLMGLDQWIVPNGRTTVNGQGPAYRVLLPGFSWPRFEQEYYLAARVQARCDREKSSECIEGYIRLKVLVDQTGKVLTHQVLKSEDAFLARVVAEELSAINFRPAEALDGGSLPPTLWGFLDFEFRSERCR